MMKDKTGLIIAIVGVLMLLGIIIYQAQTKTAITYLIPVAIIVNLYGVFLHIKRNRK